MISLLEQLSANAWPAEVNQWLDGWLLRYADGVSRRANSVLALSTDVEGFEERLRVVEEFYGRRGLPARFHLSPASPPDLDRRLEERGYRVEAPTWVQTASVVTVRERAAVDTRFEVTLLEAPDDPWFEVYHLDPSHKRGQRAVRAGIMSRIGPSTVFALLRLGGRPIAVGQGVAERGWVGLFSIVTHPQFRRQGAGTALVRALTEWGAGQGAAGVYLQVMETSIPAISLYMRLGFEPLYQYHYREQSD